MNIFQFIEKFNKINPDRLVQDAVLLNGDKAILLNQQQLYQHSIDSDGKQLRDYASFEYAKEKQRLNPFLGLGKPDLFVTGSFYESEYLEVKGDKMIFGFTDFKTSKLEKKYGIKIAGLTNENKAFYANQHVIPYIRKEISELTGLRFK